MKTVVATLSENIEVLELHTFSDWHIGDNLCDHKAIGEQIASVRDNPNAYAILNGDLMNNATKTSVSDCYAASIPPQQQLEMLTDLLMPIKDKILLINTGNHEARTYRNDGIDLSACLAVRLGAEEKYTREGGLLFVRFGSDWVGGRQGKSRICYTVYATHGSGGGRKEGGKINRLADLASIVDADIYIHSHTHSPAILKQSFYRTNSQKMTVTVVPKLFVNSSALLDYGGYGESASFKPSNKDNPTIFLQGARSKKMWAKL